MGATKLRHKPRLLHAPIKMAARGKFEPARGPFLAAGKKKYLGGQNTNMNGANWTRSSRSDASVRALSRLSVRLYSQPLNGFRSFL